MPFIGTKTSCALSKEKEISIKQRLGQAIAILPGKSERSLMLSFEDNCRMYFRGGSDSPMAFVEVKILGTSTKEYFSKLSAAICDILNDELSIPSENVYIKYEEVTHWGWNGSNF